MGSSHTPAAIPAMEPLYEVQTTASLVLGHHTSSRSSLLQYLNVDIMCSEMVVLVYTDQGHTNLRQWSGFASSTNPSRLP